MQLHVVVATYEPDRAGRVRRVDTRCAVDGLPWPCPAEIARALAAAAARR